MVSCVSSSDKWVEPFLWLFTFICQQAQTDSRCTVACFCCSVCSPGYYCLLPTSIFGPLYQLLSSSGLYFIHHLWLIVMWSWSCLFWFLFLIFSLKSFKMNTRPWKRSYKDTGCVLLTITLWGKLLYSLYWGLQVIQKKSLTKNTCIILEGKQE